MRKWVFLLLLLSVFYACNKDEHEQPFPQEPQEAPYYGELVRAIEWTSGVKAKMYYNTDSTLQQIDYSFQNIRASTVFEWENKKMKVMHDDRSLYKNTYHYNGDRVSHYINSPKQIAWPTSYKMEYLYKANSQLKQLKYLTINEAGTELKTTTDYEYNTAGDLIKATTISGNSIITHTIENYSDTADFNPLLFIDVALHESYTIFNLAVMSRLKKYPAKIIRTVKTGNAQPYIDKIDEHTCEISNRRINKITSKITIPGMPQYSNTTTGTFIYEQPLH